MAINRDRVESVIIAALPATVLIMGLFFINGNNRGRDNQPQSPEEKSKPKADTLLTIADLTNK